MLYTILYTKEPEGGYTVECVDLPGCVSYGDTMDHAGTMIQEAIHAYRTSQAKHQSSQKIRPFYISTMMVNEAIYA